MEKNCILCSICLLDDAVGRAEVIVVFLRELAGLPKAIIYEYLRERRKMKMAGKFASRFDFEPGSRNETLAALAPFLLFGALPVLLTYLHSLGFVPLWFEIVFVIVFWLSGFSLLVIGFKRGCHAGLCLILGCRCRL